MATVIPPFERFAGLGQGLQNFVAANQQRQQQQALSQFLQQQGIQAPVDLPPQFLQQLALQQQQGQQALQRQVVQPLSPTQRQVERRLNRIDLLEGLSKRNKGQNRELEALKRLSGLAEKPPANTPRFFVTEFGFTEKEAQAAAEVAKGIRPKTLNQLSSLELTRMAEVLQASASPEAFSVGQKIADIAATKIKEELLTGQPFGASGIPKGLENVWPSMTKEERAAARQVLKAGTATVPQILELLK